MRIIEKCNTCESRGLLIENKIVYSWFTPPTIGDEEKIFLPCEDCNGTGAVAKEDIFCPECLSDDIDNLGDNITAVCGVCDCYFVPFGGNNEDEGKIDKFNRSKLKKRR